MSRRKRVTRARRSATARVLQLHANLEDRAAMEQLVLLHDMRRNALEALGRSSGFRTFQLSGVLTEIDREISRLMAEAQMRATNVTTRALALGGDLVDGILATVKVPPGLMGVSSQLTNAVLDVTLDQIRSVWSELGTTLKGNVRRVVFGITDPAQAIQNVAAMIRDPKTFGRPETRAEIIIRTEVNRTFNLATQERLRQSNARLGGGLRKYWLTASDDRVRPSHVQAGEDYAPDGDPGPIPVDQRFVVGTARLMEPGDPSGPPEETINCRCRSVPYVEEVAAALAA